MGHDKKGVFINCQQIPKSCKNIIKKNNDADSALNEDGRGEIIIKCRYLGFGGDRK